WQEGRLEVGGKSGCNRATRRSKEKYTETLEFVKQDLNEFSQMVQRNTACPITVTASMFQEKLKVLQEQQEI
uniref:Uncharacterized protein n=1 Tax=Sarcophilus harrisii TaxID=9305 RepID=A0A7N4V1E1_SARHA